MRGGFPAARTHANLDPDTPVISLGDPTQYRREQVILYDDEERDLLAHVVGRERVMRQRGIDAMARKAWHETLFGRVAIIAGLVAAVADLAATIHALTS